ncbi:CDP-diacylglycerol--serine O-phosphatidyltransferase [Shewanella intestini]|uniref:CDP-diacylglycerol--serine O-phosphatidyltransferase n=1 Tax=Shewanella intestini TaxID=2017544 RepID=A0ABS5I1B8_9GAMM|nr:MULTISPECIES: CDP-diacylglycerol--serine O-phosphatidyltransferase [Shewanella]MBR9727195.1 CDP-diacylglycerol--serine O-phosphatidyltransferase [Shewanella intestini]MRG35997.1 CDP-diacylglycerol--serine O-phosphatidyltransferase [Shewanella sp. XMDDZSB0408]
MLDKLGGISLNADALSWLLTPQDFKKTLLEKIEQATTSIIISALYVEDDEAGREILHALMAAKAKNPQLEVNVLVDFHRARRGLIGHKGDSGNYILYRKLIAQAQYPINIVGVPVKSREFMGVLHLKGFIIDDVVIFSGASLNNIYLHQQQKYRFDRYHMLESKALATSMREMIEKYILADPAVCSLTQPAQTEVLPDKQTIRSFKLRLAKAKYEFDATRIGNRVTPIVGLGRKKNKLNEAVVGLVNNAQEHLFICTPYFNPPRPLNLALSKHLREGKKIDIVVGDKTANDFFIPTDQPFSTIGALPYMYEQTLRKFAKRQQWAIESGQLNIYLWKHNINSYHLKGISADDKTHLITGSNLNPRAWALDLENGLLVHDESGVWKNSFKQEQQHILEHTERLFHYSQIETLQSYPAPVRKVMNRIRRLRADFLLRRIL